jgi:hypothetical protein
MFFPHVATALAEFRRVLSPRGLLGVSTWQVSQAEDLSAVLVDLGLADRETGWIADADALKRHLSDAGFSDVRVISDAHTFVYADLEQYWQNARGTGLRRWLDALDELDAIRVRDALAERVASRSRPDGLHLDAVALLALARAS